jgi:hypothetical protein
MHPRRSRLSETRSVGQRFADSLRSQCATSERRFRTNSFILDMCRYIPVRIRQDRPRSARPAPTAHRPGETSQRSLLLNAYILPLISCSMAKLDLRTTTVAERGFRSKPICITAQAKKKARPQNASPFADNSAPLHGNRPKIPLPIDGHRLPKGEHALYSLLVEHRGLGRLIRRPEAIAERCQNRGTLCDRRRIP